jgi:signal transduction histidine kinase
VGQRLERSALWLHQFASNISHQLRTPLTILRGEIEVALRQPSTLEEVKSVLKSNLAEVESMSNLVQDMLGYSKLESETPETPSPVELDRLVISVGRQASWLGRDKALDVRTEAPSVTAWIHPVRLEQALLNIVDNAVKHSPPKGSVLLRLERDAGDVLISVQDSGPGIAPEEMGELFRRGRSRTGSGLGLALARTLVESLEGSLDVQSPPGRGLLVRIRLPIRLD